MAYSADKKPGELTALTSLATDDVFVVGDTSDASEVAKYITKANLLTDLGATFEPLKGADDNFVTDAEKAALHAAVTVADSAEIDLTLTGQQISASIIAGSIDETKLDASTNASLDLADSAVQPSTSPLLTAVELGHASDTTLSRVSAGVIAVEGKTLLTTDGGTLTGNLTLGENTSIDLDPAGSADGKYSGICITGTAGAALAFGDLIYLAVADSRWELTDADATATAGTPLIGMCVLAAAGDGSATKILLQGTIRADAKFPALTVGAPAYVGETAGAIQTAIPTGADNVIRVVGRALTADELYFCPSQDHQITVA